MNFHFFFAVDVFFVQNNEAAKSQNIFFKFGNIFFLENKSRNKKILFVFHGTIVAFVVLQKKLKTSLLIHYITLDLKYTSPLPNYDKDFRNNCIFYFVCFQQKKFTNHMTKHKKQ